MRPQRERKPTWRAAESGFNLRSSNTEKSRKSPPSKSPATSAKGKVVKKQASATASVSLKKKVEKVVASSSKSSRPTKKPSAKTASPEKVQSADDVCICCGKPAGDDGHKIESAEGKVMNLKEIVKRFGGIDVANGIVCNHCILTLQTCAKFYKRCQTTQDKVSESSTDAETETSAAQSEHQPIRSSPQGLSDVSEKRTALKRKASTTDGQPASPKSANKSLVFVSSSHQKKSYSTNLGNIQTAVSEWLAKPIAIPTYTLPTSETSTNKKTILNQPSSNNSSPIETRSKSGEKTEKLAAIPCNSEVSSRTRQQTESSGKFGTQMSGLGKKVVSQSVIGTRSRSANQGKTEEKTSDQSVSHTSSVIKTPPKSTNLPNNDKVEGNQTSYCSPTIGTLALTAEKCDKTDGQIKTKPSYASMEIQCDFSDDENENDCYNSVADLGDDSEDHPTVYLQEKDEVSKLSKQASVAKPGPQCSEQDGILTAGKYPKKYGTPKVNLVSILSRNQNRQIGHLPGLPKDKLSAVCRTIIVTPQKFARSRNNDEESCSDGTKKHVNPNIHKKLDDTVVTEETVVTEDTTVAEETVVTENSAVIENTETERGKSNSQQSKVSLSNLNCGICKEVFSTAELLLQHLQSNHRILFSSPTKSSGIPPQTNPPSKLMSVLSGISGAIPAHASKLNSGSKKIIFVKVYKKPLNTGKSAATEIEKHLNQTSQGEAKTQNAVYDDHSYDKDTSATPSKRPRFHKNYTLYDVNFCDTEEASPKTPKELPPVVCGVCNIAYYNTKQLSAHYIENHNKLFTDLTAEHIEAIKAKKVVKYRCKLCSLEFGASIAAGAHVSKEHMLPSPYKCCLCEKSCNSKKRIKCHLATHFPNKGMIRCWKCDEEFPHRDAVSDHSCWKERVETRVKAVESKPLKSKDIMDSDTEGGDQYFCPLCEFALPSKKQLKDHWMDAHNSDGDKVINRSSVILAFKAEKDDFVATDDRITEDSSRIEISIDPALNNSFISKDSLQMRTDKFRMYLCTLCCMSFRTTLSLAMHWRQRHNFLFRDLVAENSTREITVAVHKYKCSICSQCFTSEAAVTNHMRVVHSMPKPFICSLCNRALTTRKKMRIHLAIHFPNKVYRCSECPRVFTSQHEMFRHSCWMDFIRLRLEHGGNATSDQDREIGDTSSVPKVQKPRQCCLCRHTVVSTRQLSLHWEQTHDQYFETLEDTKAVPMLGLPNPSMPYQCEYCGAEFRTRKLFDRHRSKHILPKCFKCSICSQTFDSRGKVRLHLRFHLSSRPYICKVCGKSFFAGKHLKNHERALHGPKEDRCKCVCEMCGKGFRLNHSLKRHMEVIHDSSDRGRNHKCGICGKAYFVKSRLVYHMASHLDHKPHICNVCGKGFKKRIDLRVHMKWHTGSFRRTCSWCKREFSHSGLRTAHVMVEHHKGCPSCGVSIFTLKDAQMHRRACDGFAKVRAAEVAADAATGNQSQVQEIDETVVAQE